MEELFEVKDKCIVITGGAGGIMRLYGHRTCPPWSKNMHT